MENACKLLLTHGNIATMQTCDVPYGMIADGAVALEDGRIVAVGSQDVLINRFANWSQHDLEGRLVTPGLIDCHTHLVFGGHRAVEFEMRLNGASYAEISRAGGGIVSTVTATRGLSVSEMVTVALPRLDAFLVEGVTVVEVKSGYGLDVETELNMLRAARMLQEQRPVTIKTSFLGAHAVPTEFQGRADAYIDDCCIPALRAAHSEGLVDAVDGFCEGIGFTPAQIGRVFAVAQSLGLPVKLHAEQLSNIGGTQLAARFDALSADHVEYATEADAVALAAAGCVAVLLPGAFYTLHEKQAPPIAHFRTHSVPMALATDCNPGSSPMSSVLLAMNMGCTLFGLTPQEALAGVTRHAATALGLLDHGQIKDGFVANLAIWNVETPAELAYRIGANPLHSRIFKGAFA